MKKSKSLAIERSRMNFYCWIKKHYLPEIASQIKDAWVFVLNTEQGFQTRRDGTTVMSHLESTANSLHRWGFHFEYVIAALLHDTVEDCSSVTIKDLKKRFGSNVSEIVDFMSKNILGKHPDYIHKVENWLERRPCFVFVRLADQFHNVRNYQGYRNSQSMRENCHEIINMLELAKHIMSTRPKLLQNTKLVADLHKLELLAKDHLRGLN